MRILARQICLAFLFAAVCLLLIGSTVYADVEAKPVIELKEMAYWADRNSDTTIEDLLKHKIAPKWEYANNADLNLGYHSAAVWVRFDIKNHRVGTDKQLLEIGYALLDYVNVYLVSDDQVLQDFVLGDAYSFETRPIAHRHFVIPLTLPPGKTSLYMRIETSSSVQLPMQLWNPLDFYETDQKFQLAHGLFHGALLIMAAYNLFVWFMLRSAAYLYHVFFVLSFSLLVLTIDGFAFQYLWPESVWWQNQSICVFVAITTAFGFMFCRQFLSTAKYSPRLDLVARSLLYLNIIFATVSVFVTYSQLVKPALVLAGVSCSAMLLIGIIQYARGYHAARFYVLAWACLLIIMVLYVFGKLALFSALAPYLESAPKIGAALMVSLLSFALTDRINAIRKEKDKAKEREFSAKQEVVRIQAANQAKTIFLANMSHELRTPINAVIGYSEILIEDAEEDGEAGYVTDLYKIRDAGKHLLNLIGDILDLTKIEAGKMDLTPVRFSVRRLIDTVCDGVRPLLEANGNKLDVNISNDVTELFQDDVKMRQILFNLLSNSAKFTKNGRVSLTVEVISVNGDRMIEFEIKDTGIGMSENQMERVFDSFTQADASSTRKYGGTGLGLTITKSFCELLGGTISLESQEGKGSRFIVRLPVNLKHA
ncbi:MAG: 7TM diverse intracellular signaling domain-containing protein [Ketobacteraceae bacterium]|nr:7TM diverse intracellular signaling domain-containing protein [Ketobacteraceae bacterium]